MHRYLAVTLMAAAAAACSGGQSQGAAPDTSQAMMMSGGDVATIRSAIDANNKAITTAINSGDAAAMAAMYADDAVNYSAGEEPAAGKAAILASAQKWLGSMKVNATASTDTLIVMGDLALEIGQYSGTMTPNAAGASPIQDHGRLMTLWKKQPDGSWKIFRDMSNSSVPMPTPK